MYVEELIGPETVNTMPLETIQAFQDHGEVKRAARSSRASTRRAQLLADLAAAGVDYDDVVATLEAEGVQKFADSFDELLDGIRAKRGAARRGVTRGSRRSSSSSGSGRYDASLWTGSDEDRWLGWLDVVTRAA